MVSWSMAVAFLETDREFWLNVKVGPEGDTVADKLTVPAKPLRLLNMMDVNPLDCLPRRTCIGKALRSKSGGGRPYTPLIVV